MSQIYLKEYIRYNRPSLYESHHKICSLQGSIKLSVMKLQHHKKLSSENQDIQLQLQLRLELFQWQLFPPRMLSFIDSFMHLTYIYPELNMVLDCGIQECTRHRLSLQNLGEREEQLSAMTGWAQGAVEARLWRWRGQGQFPGIWRTRGTSLVKRREKSCDQICKAPGRTSNYRQLKNWAGKDGKMGVEKEANPSSDWSPEKPLTHLVGQLFDLKK